MSARLRRLLAAGGKVVRSSGYIVLSLGLAALVLAAFLLLPTSSYRATEQGPVTLYYADNISRAHQFIIDRFNAEYEGRIHVVPIDLPFTKFSTNERKELLARTMRSKSGRIDVFTVDIIWVPRFARWCQSLDDYFSPADREAILEHALQSCYWDGQLVAIPLYTDVGLMYYREDLLRRIPGATALSDSLRRSLTWEQFIALKQHCNRLGIENPFYVFPADNYEGLVCSVYEGMAGQGCVISSQDAIDLTRPPVVRTVRLLTDLVHRYHMAPPEVTKFDEYEGYLYALEHDALFIRGWPGFVKHYRNAVRDTSKFSYLRLAALPHFAGHGRAFVYGGWNFMISRYSTKTDAAVTFIKYCLRKENQKLLFVEGGYIPINREIYADSAFLAEHQDLAFYRELLDLGVHRPYLVDYTKISDVIAYYAHLAIRNELSAEEALARATRLINSKQVLIK
ncbi:MAG: extracellular solute-binding protein [candidate division KSB1 bacterium]|nr:extracellular solute-binding protein [candidate division KSB1 bacterium]